MQAVVGQGKMEKYNHLPLFNKCGSIDDNVALALECT